MENTITKHQRNLAAFIHLSTFTKYIFPFGNFIFPLMLWVLNKDKDAYVDQNGKQAINFQISLLLYGIILGTITIPILLMTGWEFAELINFWQYNGQHVDFNLVRLPTIGTNVVILGIIGVLAIVLALMDIVCTILATLRSNEGVLYTYPLSIKFLK
ncbi:DUF4870 domain-containing protein [Galbibacter sp.]|uniref:DUF4870 domain-containing protein n=1 Tax=Galbibacter sp. TaxID=2918471 RepID=UPI002B6D656F|nr:DUF4870 domain-containing protein [Galbibacter sp.]HLV61904.1 DUF4870 domain-containing protein [Galbibacter sp.]